MFSSSLAHYPTPGGVVYDSKSSQDEARKHDEPTRDQGGRKCLWRRWEASPRFLRGDGLFTLGVSAGLAGSVLDIWGVLEPLPFVDHLAVNVSGAAVLTAGAVFALVAQTQMGRSWRAGIDMSNDYELITRGLFESSVTPSTRARSLPLQASSCWFQTS
jgi:hypothetical protein